MKSLLHSIRDVLEYTGLRFAFFVAQHAPLWFLDGLVLFAADTFFLLSGKRRKISEENIRLAGITEDPKEIRRIARESFRHFGRVAVESLQFAHVANATNWRNYVDVQASPKALEVMRDHGSPAIMASAHLGNWEIAVQLGAFYRPLVGVARTMNNPLVDKLIREKSSRKHVRIVSKSAGPRPILALLKRGEALALLIDQHARQTGVRIDFLGRPASTHTSPARFSLAFDAPIVFGYCIRKSRMSYQLVMQDPIRIKKSGDRDRDIQLILEKMTRALEDAIRQHPEQYLWAHRRWK